VLSTETWSLPHYAAPICGVMFLIVTQCTRHLVVWNRRGTAGGRLLSQLIPLFLAATLVVRVADAAVHRDAQKAWPRGNVARAEILRRVEMMAGKHLILVTYGPRHDPRWEWVYNHAEIDGAKVVWARDMGNRDNQELLQYFHGRQVWHLEPDASPPKLSSFNPN
jgi:hypothetical protein